MPLVRLPAAIAFAAMTAFAATSVNACDDRFPWTCQPQQPAATQQTAPQDANASATAPQARRAASSRKARTARKSANRVTWKRKAKTARRARENRTLATEESTPKPQSVSNTNQAENEAPAASAASEAASAPAPDNTLAHADAPATNPAARDRAFAGLRDPIAKPSPAPRSGLATYAMLAPVSTAAATTFVPLSSPPTVISDESAASGPATPAPAETSTVVASLDAPAAFASAAQHPSQPHSGTWLQRMLMVLGGALAVAWTTRLLVA